MRESVASSNRWPKQGTLALFAIVVGGFLAFYFLTQPAVRLQMVSHGFSNGEHKVAIRALDAGDMSRVIYERTNTMTVENGLMNGIVLPSGQSDRSYIVEVCA